MNAVTSEYNIRQYNQMRAAIARFQRGMISLDDLVQDLEALCCALQGKTQSWIESFEPKVSSLEEINAVILDRGDIRPNVAEMSLVDETLKELLYLIDRAIKKKSNEHEVTS